MRKPLLLTLIFALVGTLAAPASVFAASAVRTHVTYTDNTAVGGSETKPTATATPTAENGTMVVTGKVVSPNGALPGAVIRLKGTQQMTVTDANGEFQLTVPADGRPQQATISFAGFEDEQIDLLPTEQNASLELSKVHHIAIKRNQRLNVYLKTAHRQARKASRQVHRTN